MVSRGLSPVQAISGSHVACVRMVTPTTDKSIKRFHSRPRARVRLFCFPWAGVGASAFFRWSQDLPHEIEVNAVQYPGREDRYRETPIRRVSPLVELLLRDLHSYRDRPFAFWGHSMGALVAYELTRQLTARRTITRAPVRLRATAAAIAGALGPIHDLPDAEFFRELQRRYRGVPEPSPATPSCARSSCPRSAPTSSWSTRTSTSPARRSTAASRPLAVSQIG